MIKNEKGTVNIFIIGLIVAISAIVALVVSFGVRKKSATEEKTTEKTTQVITTEAKKTTFVATTESPKTTEAATTEKKETTEAATTEALEQDTFNKQDARQFDKDQVLAAVERFCREQIPDLNNMSPDEYYYYWEFTGETEQEYEITFRSYTGAFTYFYVNRETGNVTTMEYVPGITDGETPGTWEFQIWDYMQ